MPDTAIAIALTEAGYRDPLNALAHEAWQKWSSADAGGARRDFVKTRLQRELTWALIEQWQPQALTQAIGWLLNRAKQEIEDERPQRDARQRAGGGQSQVESHHGDAPANSSREHAKPQAERGSESANGTANPRLLPPVAPNLTVLSDKQAAAMAVRLQVEARLCRLDTVKIDGKPIGDCTVGEVKTWAARRQTEQRAAGRDARFALALVANLPSHAVIRQWVKPAEADNSYDRAEAEYAA